MSEVKRDVELEWKEHNIDCRAMEAWVRQELGEATSGCSSGAKFVVHLLIEGQEADDAEAAIRAKWDELDDDQHAMCLSYESRDQLAQKAADRAEALKAKKLAMIEKTWANMDAVERKLYLGLDSEVSDEALGL